MKVWLEEVYNQKYHIKIHCVIVYDLINKMEAKV